MTGAVKGRVVLLVPLLWLLLTQGVARGHALPGSVLTFSQADNQLSLMVSVPVEELIFAEPALAPLAEHDIDGEISAQLEVQIANYFTSHMLIQHQNADVPLILEGVSLSNVSNEDVGEYMLLSLQWSVSIRRPIQEPVVLTYDAIMHEVRTHRAKVYWSAPQTDLIPLAAFGYKRINGKPKSQHIRLPQ